MNTRHATPLEARAQPRTGHRGRFRPDVRLCVLPALLILWTAAGCRPGPDEPGIDRETFITVQVELRLASMEAEPEEVPAVRRDSILTAHGVTEEAMRAFVEVHGQDEAYMTDIWREVDEGVLEARGMEPADGDSSRHRDHFAMRFTVVPPAVVKWPPA